MKELRQSAPAETLHLPAPAEPKRGESRPFVLKCIGEGMRRLDIMKAGESLGINERMIDGAITRLKANKQIAAIDGAPGHFKLVPQKSAQAKPKSSPTKE
jgi:hypothetical protein